MIRILTETEEDAITITVDGQLAGEDVETLSSCLKQAQWQGKQVFLFLRDVSDIDQSGQALLSRLAAEGVRLSAAGVYCAYVINELTRGHPRLEGLGVPAPKAQRACHS